MSDVVWLCRCGQAFASGETLRAHVQRAARNGEGGHDLAALRPRPPQEGSNMPEWLQKVDGAVLDRLEAYVEDDRRITRNPGTLWVNVGRTGISFADTVGTAMKTDPPRFVVLWDRDTHALVLVPHDRPLAGRVLTARRPSRGVRTSWRVERVGLMRWIRSRCACLDRPGIIHAVAQVGRQAPGGRPVLWVMVPHHDGVEAGHE